MTFLHDRKDQGWSYLQSSEHGFLILEAHLLNCTETQQGAGKQSTGGVQLQYFIPPSCLPCLPSTEKGSLSLHLQRRNKQHPITPCHTPAVPTSINSIEKIHPSLADLFSVIINTTNGFLTLWKVSFQVSRKWHLHLVVRYIGKICLQFGRPGFNPWVRKIPWRRKWQPTPVLLPGESHGGRSLGGYSPWDGKESDMAKQLTHTFVYQLYFNEAAKTKQNPRKV